MLSLLCGEPGCAVARAFSGNFLVLIVGLAAGVGSFLPAMRREE